MEKQLMYENRLRKDYKISQPLKLGGLTVQTSFKKTGKEYRFFAPSSSTGSLPLLRDRLSM